MTKEEILQMEPGPELDRLVAERVLSNPDLIRPQLREGAEVLVRCPEYDGWAVIKGFNNDDTCDVLIEETGRRLRVYCNQIVKVVGQSPWSPSTDIAAAWEVVEKLASQGIMVVIESQGPLNNIYKVLFYRWGTNTIVGMAEGDICEAICRAALLAVQSGEEGKP